MEIDAGPLRIRFGRTHALDPSGSFFREHETGSTLARSEPVFVWARLASGTVNDGRIRRGGSTSGRREGAVRYLFQISEATRRSCSGSGSSRVARRVFTRGGHSRRGGFET